MIECMLCGGTLTSCSRCHGVCREPVCAVCRDADPVTNQPSPVAVALPTLATLIAY